MINEKEWGSGRFKEHEEKMVVICSSGGRCSAWRLRLSGNEVCCQVTKKLLLLLMLQVLSCVGE